MRHRYMDAMALVRRYGKPDIFLTMTCNPNWNEIRNELYPGQSAQDRPDLVTRVFRAKLEAMKKKLLKNDILGKVRVCCGVSKEGSTTCSLLAHNEKEMETHVSRAVRSTYIC